MKKIPIIIATTILLGGCSTPGKFVGQNTDNDCDGKGRVFIDIGYGDAYIYVTPKSKVKPKGEIVYKLKPDKNALSGVDYKEKTIEIDGKTSSDDWLNASPKYGDGKKKFFICVDQNQPAGSYNFEVVVPGVGTIDPRVDVYE